MANDYTAESYGEALADIYDLMYPDTPDAHDAGKFLADLAGHGGSVLELGVGTGRIAVHTASHGVRVHGVDASQSMLDKLHKNNPNTTVTTEKLDFITQSTGRKFDVVAVPLSTFFAASTPTAQLNVMKLMKEQLSAGGTIVLEGFDPTDYHAQRTPKTETLPLADGRLQINTTFVDRIRQLLIVDHVTIGPEGAYNQAKEIVRYVFPTEMDMMALSQGLNVTARYGDWKRSPLTASSLRHVSLYKNLEHR
ncbi:class I SAM-dependent methyltransferase [Corynebacterium timonense]|uniref:Methyltransferase domain-containing protein n=1 Tax=Corynebacterium timonense TaxID=441500 RepID=A0A1H1S3Q1_9CORY|nr:class I SAM-dependent methyltransferase [Corynebacterium timonense]SDS42523.1 Methyltransferase domain-containing protein [Corynebacterium timonense]